MGAGTPHNAQARHRAELTSSFRMADYRRSDPETAWH